MFKITAIITILVLGISIPLVSANEDESLAFAGYLEETLGHFWAIEQNLDESNAELALVHATHPIAELYLSMKPQLLQANPEFDLKIQKTLIDLKKDTGSDVSRKDAQMALDNAKQLIEEARNLVIGNELSSDTKFRTNLMIGLLSTSIGEYEEAVKDGQIDMMAEFQDGSAFVWRSQQIFEEIKDELPKVQSEKIAKKFPKVWDAYDQRLTSAEMNVLVNEIIQDLESTTGEKLSYSIEKLSPLKQIKSGILPKDVKCNDDRQIVFKKSTGNPACVKLETAQRLVNIGWAIIQ